MAFNQMDLTILVSAATLILIGLVLLPYGLWGRKGWAPIAWGMANIAHGVGWIVTTLPGYLSSPVLLVLANLLFTVGLGLLWSGTARFMSQHRSALLLAMPSLVILIAFPVLFYIMPGAPARIVVVSVVNAIGCGDSGRMLMKSRHWPTRLLGYVLIGMALFQVLRGLDALAAIWYPKPLPSTLQMAPAAILMFTVWTVGMLVSSAHRSEQQLNELVTGLKRASLTDQLTELPNRRFMQQRLEEAQQRLDKLGEVFSLLILDLDHFKEINDAYGHEVGDQALQFVAHTLQRRLDSEYLLARWGGEEFVVLMPNTDATRAQQVAEQLREALSGKRIDYGDASLQVTMTIGGATASSDHDLTEVIRRADHALYQGKQMGRNQVAWA